MDLKLLARHIQFYALILSTAPLSDFFKPNADGSRLMHSPQAPTLAEAKHLARRCLISNNHPIGACTIGKREPGWVVDERLRAHGSKRTEGRGCNCIPLMIRGNDISSVYAIAEAKDLIQGDAKRR